MTEKISEEYSRFHKGVQHKHLKDFKNKSTMDYESNIAIIKKRKQGLSAFRELIKPARFFRVFVEARQ